MTAGRRLFLIVATAGMAVTGFFLVRAAGDDAVYYLYPHEAVERRSDFVDGRVFNLAGRVVPGSLDQSGAVTTFSVTDEIETISVELSAGTPPLFEEGIEVLVEGAFDGDRFVSDSQPVIRHAAEYEAPEQGNAPSAEGS